MTVIITDADREFVALTYPIILKLFYNISHCNSSIFFMAQFRVIEFSLQILHTAQLLPFNSHGKSNSTFSTKQENNKSIGLTCLMWQICCFPSVIRFICTCTRNVLESWKPNSIINNRTESWLVASTRHIFNFTNRTSSICFLKVQWVQAQN